MKKKKSKSMEELYDQLAKKILDGKLTTDKVSEWQKDGSITWSDF